MENGSTRDTLYERMNNELQVVRTRLLAKSPDEILCEAGEYLLKKAILMMVECGGLPEARLKSLLSLPAPLDAVYTELDDIPINYMDAVREALEVTADKTVG